MAGQRSATIKDVAAAAGSASPPCPGCSPADRSARPPASACGPPRASWTTARAPSAAASLRRSGGIGLIVPDVTDPFRAELVAGVLSCARSLGEHVIVDAAHGDPAREAEIVERLAEQRVDGIIAVPAGTEADWRGAARVCSSVVFADRVLPGLPEIPAVLADDSGGVRALTEYLAGLGHRRIGFLGGVPGAPPGARARVPRHPRPARRPRRGGPGRRRPPGPRRRLRRRGRAAAAPRRRHRDPRRGHLLGEAAVLVARELDLRVPADVSIAMMDDVAWAELCDPPLTAVARSGHDIGYRACELLLREPARRGRGEPVLLPTELVVRGSCGPLRPPRR